MVDKEDNGVEEGEAALSGEVHEAGESDDDSDEGDITDKE